MDGYTVEEAASVLGVPRERVWELLARGILSGATDLAGGMRVHLKADPPAPPDPSPAHPDRAGNGGHGGESTPFRELLTEFRSLTERYGQALLALGEARGEVAGLRSRIEGLEARIDLRLPTGSGPASSWRSEPWPVPSERIVEQASARSGPVSDEGGQHPDDEPRHRRRARSGRRATESFADALARAEDPSVPELPGAAEAAAALAALSAEPSRTGLPTPETDIALPRDLPSAQAVPVADEPGADAALPPQPAVVSDTAVEPPPAPAEPVTAAAEPPGAEAEPPTAEAESPAPEAEATVAEGEPTAAKPPTVVPEAAADDSAGAGPRDHPRYSAAVDEPDWIAVDELAPHTSDPPELEEGLAALAALANAPSSSGPGEPAPDSAGEVAAEPVPATQTGGPVPTMAAVDRVPRAPRPEAEPEERADAMATGSLASEPRRARPEPAWTWSPPPVRPTPPPPLVPRSPATRAYRRLRRIFPQ